MKKEILLFLALAGTGCSKSDGKADAAPVTASASAAPSASTAPSASAAAAESARSYSGTYTLAPSKLYIPEGKDWSSVKQAKDDPSKHVGEGNLSLVVESDRHVNGTIDSGPGSPAVIHGTLVGTELRGTVRRKDPKDNGLTGTLVANTESGTGTLSLADAHGAVVREGKVTLEKK